MLMRCPSFEPPLGNFISDASFDVVEKLGRLSALHRPTATACLATLPTCVSRCAGFSDDTPSA